MYTFYHFIPAHNLVDKYYTGYYDSNMVTTGGVVAEYTCETQGFPPTWLSWKRNGELVIVDDIHYSIKQIVTDRMNSSFKNSLMVYDIKELLGEPVYQCNVTSHFGSVIGDINEGLTGT